MAVLNKYVDANLVAGKLTNPAFVYGAQSFITVWTFEVAAADDDGSIFRVAKVPANLIPVKFDIFNDALTAGTVWDIGLYKPSSPPAGTAVQTGAVILDACFASGLDLSSAHTVSSPLAGYTSAVDQAAVVKRIFEHAGHTESNKLTSYDIALTADTIGSAAGTVSGIFHFVQG